MPIFWTEGVLNPFSVPLKVEKTPIIFLCHPTNENDIGWGKPLVNPETNKRLPLGTLEGEDQVKTVLFKEIWRKGDIPGNQVYGNIDWRGPVLNEETGERLNVSFNGPRLRYFKDPDFQYDDTSKNHEVYYRGGYLGIAPKPVLGAGVRVVEDVWYLFVICKHELEDYVYVREVSKEPVYGEISSEKRAEMQALYSTTTGTGWRFVYSVPRQNRSIEDDQEDLALEATTPWFFNMSCTQAVCMRDVLVTFTDTNDEEIEEEGLAKYFISLGNVDGGEYTFDYFHNTTRFTFREKHYFDRYIAAPYYSDSWCFTPCGFIDSDENDDPCYDIYNLAPEHGPEPIQLVHYYARFRLEQERLASGEYIIATDFDEDLSVIAKVSIQCFRRHRQELNWGVDCNANYDKPLEDKTVTCGSTSVYHINTCPNACSNDGKPACNQAPDEPPYYGNGSIAPWQAGQSFVTLKFSNSKGLFEVNLFEDSWSTLSEYENGERTGEEDVNFEFHGITRRYFHYFDMRNPFVLSYTEKNVEEFVPIEQGIPSRYGDTSYVSSTTIQSEYYMFGSVTPVRLTNETLDSYTDTGRSIGYNWKGNPYSDTPDVDYGGPGWTRPQDDGYYETEFIKASYAEVHDRNPSAPWEPEFEDWYDPGILSDTEMPNWYSFFDNSSGFNLLEGGWCVNDSKLFMSYRVEAVLGDGSVVENRINVIRTEDGEEGSFEDLFPGAEKAYPIGVY